MLLKSPYANFLMPVLYLPWAHSRWMHQLLHITETVASHVICAASRHREVSLALASSAGSTFTEDHHVYCFLYGFQVSDFRYKAWFVGTWVILGQLAALFGNPWHASDRQIKRHIKHVWLFIFFVAMRNILSRTCMVTELIVIFGLLEPAVVLYWAPAMCSYKPSLITGPVIDHDEHIWLLRRAPVWEVEASLEYCYPE